MDPHRFIDDLVHYSYVVSAGGFTAASQKHNIPKSRLSRRVARLENLFGLALLNRSNSQFAVTPVGMQIYQCCQRIIAEADSAMSCAYSATSEPQGELRICCPVVITQIIVGRLVAAFAKEHPTVRIILEVTNRLVDPMVDGYDLVIRPTPERLPNSDLIARKIGTGKLVFVGHPNIFGDQPRNDPMSLHNISVLGYGTLSGPQEIALIGPGGAQHVLQFQPAFLSDNLMTIKEAVLAGVGAAILPDTICRDELESGRLVLCCPDWHPPPMSFYALYPSRLGLTAAGRTFLAFLGNQLQKELG